MLLPVRYRNKVTQSGIFLVQFWNEMTDDGMPIPALVFWMPMPTFDYYFENILLSQVMMTEVLVALTPMQNLIWICFKI
jgi:hypothetical protein